MQGFTALHGAANKGHEPIARVLLSQGATVSSTTTTVCSLIDPDLCMHETCVLHACQFRKALAVHMNLECTG